MKMGRWVSSLAVAALLAVTALVGVAGTAGVGAEQAHAQVANPSLEDTARLLGYMWGDGSQNNAGVWDVNGPSGTSSLVEELIDRHGGTFIDRGRLRFTLPAPYDWDEWTNGLPDDSSTVRAAVQDPNFLAALLETEATVGGQIYDQSACCVNGYTVGRLTELRDLLRSSGYSTASIEIFTNADSGRVMVAASQWDNIRRNTRFVCPESNAVIRIPGGSDLGTYGDLRWISAGSSWGDVVRTDCTTGQPVPNARPPVGSCTASRAGNELRLDWSYTLGTVVIRVDGAYVDTVSGRDGSWTGSVGGGDQNVVIRVSAFGERADSNCRFDGGGGPDGGCQVVAAGDRVELSWDNFGESSYSIRRNGSWLKNVNGTATTASGSSGDSWVIRYRQNGSVVDVRCSADGGGDGPCTITNRASGVRVDWDGVAGVDEYQIRRNGSWVGEAVGQSRFDDTSGWIGADYEIRYRVNGSRRSINC